MNGFETECPWRIEHLGHLAWFQRVLMAGDFAPDLAPISNYVVIAGRAADPGEAPRCGTCGVVPRTRDLEAVEIATGARNFLARFRLRPGTPGWRPWPRPTNPATCWWCNFPEPLVVDQGPVKLCAGCLEHLKRY
jgi:hypothetical protein